MTDLPTLALIIIGGLATARITGLIVEDSILESLRHRLFEWSPPPDDLERGLLYQGWTSENEKSIGWIGSLVACHYCVAVWVGGAVWAAIHFEARYALPVVGVAAISQVADIAWKASR